MQQCRFCYVELSEPRGSHLTACPFYISVNGDNQKWGKKNFDFSEAVKLFEAGFEDGKNTTNTSPQSDNPTYIIGWSKARGLTVQEYVQ